MLLSLQTNLQITSIVLSNRDSNAAQFVDLPISMTYLCHNLIECCECPAQDSRRKLTDRPVTGYKFDTWQQH